MARKQPSVDKAAKFILNYIGKERLSAGAQLPPIRELAFKADVAVATMDKALSLLCAEKTVATRQGKGIFVQKLPAESKKVLSAKHKPKWQGLKENIAADIINGYYHPGQPLPSLKELRMHYGTSYLPLKKALSALTKELGLQIFGKSYKVPIGAHAFRATLAMIVPVMEGKRLSRIFNAPRGEEIFRLLERIGGRRNVDIAIAEEGERGTMRSETKKLLADNHSPCIGAILNAQSTPRIEYWLDLFAKSNKPVAIIDETGEWQQPVHIAPNQCARIFKIGSNPSAAEKVAQYMLRKGHLHAAYISFGHKNLWSHQRLDIISRAFSGFNTRNTVTFFGFNSFSEFTSAEMRQRVLNEVHALDNALQQIDDILPGSEKNEVRAVMQKIQRMRFKKYDELALATEFDKALARNDITAWIIGSDRDAVPAFNYLHQRNIRIPQDLSLISFDDSVDAFARGITSYNFNVEAIMHAIIDFLLHPPLMPRKKRSSWTDIDGFIVERGTVAKIN